MLPYELALQEPQKGCQDKTAVVLAYVYLHRVTSPLKGTLRVMSVVFHRSIWIMPIGVWLAFVRLSARCGRPSAAMPSVGVADEDALPLGSEWFIETG